MHSISSATSSSNAYLAALAAQSATQSATKPLSTGSAQSTASQPDSFTLSPSGRDLLQTGRIAVNEKAGNLTSDQATQLYSQVASNQRQIATDKTADGGTLDASDAQAVEALQNQNGQQIYSDAHNGATPPSTDAPTNPAVLRTLDQVARVGLNEKAGNLTSTQSSTLDSQIQTTFQQIVADQQGNGGPLSQSQAAAINATQSALSTQIYDLSNASSS